MACSRMRSTTSRTTRTLTSASSRARADLAEHLIDVLLGQPTLAPEPFEDAFEAIGQRVEHAADQATAAPSRASRRRMRRLPLRRLRSCVRRRRFRRTWSRTRVAGVLGRRRDFGRLGSAAGFRRRRCGGDDGVGGVDGVGSVDVWLAIRSGSTRSTRGVGHSRLTICSCSMARVPPRRSERLAPAGRAVSGRESARASSPPIRDDVGSGSYGVGSTTRIDDVRRLTGDDRVRGDRASEATGESGSRGVRRRAASGLTAGGTGDRRLDAGRHRRRCHRAGDTGAGRLDPTGPTSPAAR